MQVLIGLLAREAPRSQFEPRVTMPWNTDVRRLGPLKFGRPNQGDSLEPAIRLGSLSYSGSGWDGDKFHAEDEVGVTPFGDLVVMDEDRKLAPDCYSHSELLALLELKAHLLALDVPDS